MIAYLVVTSILLIIFVTYEGYKYFIFKYKSIIVDVRIKEIKEYEMFQTLSSKVRNGELRNLKLTFEYKINGKKYTKVERIGKDIMNIGVGDNIEVKIISNDPEKSTLKPDSIRFKNFIVALTILVFWFILMTAVILIMTLE